MSAEYLSCEYISIAMGLLLILSIFYNFKINKMLKEREDGDSVLIKNAYFNQITKLPNRTNIEIVIGEQMERSNRHDKPFLLTTIKYLNYDKEMVIEFSNLILGSIRDEDILAHIEDNVFLVLFNEYLEEKNFTILLRRFQKNLGENRKFQVEIGKSKYPDDSKNVSGLINEAIKHVQ